MKSARHDVLYYYMRNHRKCCKMQGRDISVTDKIFSIFLCTTEEIRRKLLKANDVLLKANAARAGTP